MNTKKIIKEYVLKPLVYTSLIAPVFLNLNACGLNKIQLCEELVGECMSKAAGSDNVLSFEESVKMARGLGYNGAVFPKEKIVLKTNLDLDAFFVPSGILYIGFDKKPFEGWFQGTTISCRNRKYVSLEQMQNYLNSLDDQIQGK